MALAVKNAPEAAATSPFARLAGRSAAGVGYLLGAIAVVFYALPAAWRQVVPEIINPFVSGTLLIVLVLGGVAGLSWLGLRLVNFEPPHGLKAGIFVGVAGLALIAWLTQMIGMILEWLLGSWEGAWPIGALLTAASGLGLLYLFGRWYFRPSTEDTFQRLEDQGWFSTTVYKKSQGLRVRRGTMLGILILAGCGIETLIAHNTLKYGLPDAAAGIPNTNYWYAWVPFAEIRLPLLRDVRFTVPLLLAAVSLWLAWRVVNWPTFADFLIATEAELNKVSWTTKKRLYQDTIVVLTTVVLFTLFLFVVDIAWGFLLSRVGVLQSDTSGQQQQIGTKEQPW
jgi:preprotein translocase SecE subunit